MADEQPLLELTRWHEACSDKEHERLTLPARNARKKWEELIEGSKLGSDELKSFQNIKSLESFIEYTHSTEQAHRDRRSGGTRDTLSKCIASMSKFANKYAEITEIVKADPFGAGPAVWGICSVVLTVVAQKHSQQELIHEFFTRISGSMPRLQALGELYGTERMISKLAELEEAILMFLLTVFKYYQPGGFHGSWIRFKASAFSNKIEDYLVSIDLLGREILDESRVALSSEVRTLRNNQTRGFKESREDTRMVQTEVEELKKHVESKLEWITSIENRKYRKSLETLKPKLVALSYNAAKTREVAIQQARDGSPLTSLQMLACRALIEDKELSTWLTDKTSCPVSSSVLWVTSSRNNDPSISHVAHNALEGLDSYGHRNGPIVIHSLFQTGIPVIRDTDQPCTAVTIYREAIYQLLSKFPSIIYRIETLEHASNDQVSELPATIKGLQTLLQEVIISAKKQVSDDKSLSSPQDHTSEHNSELYWIIDRVDIYNFRGSGVYNLYNMMSFLGNLRIKILITSLYTPTSLDKQWKEDIEEEGDIQGLTELIYKPEKVR